MEPAAALSLVEASPTVKLVVRGGDPLWATAAVAVVAALLGSVVGGYSSFRANEALELRRRRARAQIRRKAKIYTPIRAELVALRDACESGVHFGHWLIVREEPPPVMRRPASLHLWKDMVEDGRAVTATSKKVRQLLDEVDSRADALNHEVMEARPVFAERGEALFASLGRTPVITNWVESDTADLLRGRFDDLNLLGSHFEPAPPEIRERFVELWRADRVASDRTAEVLQADSELRKALNNALAELERAMQRIADKYESESPRD